jgi:hypothetical protein
LNTDRPLLSVFRMSAFPEHLQSLLHPRAYPHPVQAVQLVETHISWVLLTGEFAYKIKRPVHYPSLICARPSGGHFYATKKSG